MCPKVKNPYTDLGSYDLPDGITNETERSEFAQEREELIKAREWDAAYALMLDERDYSSYANQAKLMREAGLNPDLLGVDSAGGAGNMDSPSSNPVHSDGPRTSEMLNAFSSIIQALPQAIGIYNQIRTGGQQFQLNEIALEKSADDLARLEIGRQVSLDDLNDKFSVPLVDISGYSPRVRRRLGRQIENYLFDANNRDLARGFVYEHRGSSERFRQGYLDLLATYGFSTDDNVFLGVLKELKEGITNFEKSKRKYDTDYLQNMDGAAVANSDMASYKKQQSESENTLYSDLLSRANKLTESDDLGDQAKGYIMWLLLSLAPNFGVSFSSGPKGRTNTFGF